MDEILAELRLAVMSSIVEASRDGAATYPAKAEWSDFSSILVDAVNDRYVVTLQEINYEADDEVQGGRTLERHQTGLLPLLRSQNDIMDACIDGLALSRFREDISDLNETSGEDDCEAVFCVGPRNYVSIKVRPYDAMAMPPER